MKNTQIRNKRSRQTAKEKAAKRKCPNCCYKCLPIISGFILLVLIAGTITLIRGVLEVPMIINGFAPNRPVSTLATTSLSSTISSSSSSSSSQTHTYTTSASDVSRPTSTTTGSIGSIGSTGSTGSTDYSSKAKCYFVGEMEVKENISIELNSDPRSDDYLRIAEAVEKMINTTYKTSTFNTVYITTKLIGISPIYSAIRFWMHLMCSARLQGEEITSVFREEEGTINLPNNQQLKVQLNTMIIWCENSMPRCTSGYCINKNNAYCDGIEDCWNGEDEANCDCEIPFVTACSSVVNLTGRKYRTACQGSLISSSWVLTTESCADDSSFSYICAGSPNMKKYRIKSRYTLDGKDEGIALLLLETPVTFTGFQPIPLPDPMNQTETVQTSCKVTGVRNTTRQGEWRVIASDKQQIVVRESFPNLRNCQVQKGSPLLCLKGNHTWDLTAVRGGCSRDTNDYRRINHVLSKIIEFIDVSPAGDDN
ncbi:uncharacterized protein LOC116988939 [Amblyraja radiata]|uniref:uncharacterized protein LOC116988939 n=1 Tax=Amblyraja radiata TaxID=386614 RepID=UPI0014024DBA|nr:uncharacterized protein LOC116988939 [Amblyraja radiata]